MASGTKRAIASTAEARVSGCHFGQRSANQRRAHLVKLGSRRPVATTILDTRRLVRRSPSPWATKLEPEPLRLDLRPEGTAVSRSSIDHRAYHGSLGARRCNPEMRTFGQDGLFGSATRSTYYGGITLGFTSKS